VAANHSPLGASVEASECERIAVGYVTYVENLARGREANESNIHVGEREFEEVKQRIHEGPSQVAWELVLALLRRVPDERLEVYAAGPLEDLVRRWGVDLVGDIEKEASRDERFRWALGCIWLLIGDVPSTELERIVNASGGQITPVNDHGISKLIERAIEHAVAADERTTHHRPI
jgi:hypothetical protein